jgi:hypothetical protein
MHAEHARSLLRSSYRRMFHSAITGAPWWGLRHRNTDLNFDRIYFFDFIFEFNKNEADKEREGWPSLAARRTFQ